MSARAFFDTNILVYALNGDSPEKKLLAATLQRAAVEAGTAVISYQVLQELFNVGFRKVQASDDGGGSANFS